ncbi:hypothetical protein STEG23_005320 [Scotinomys teguina]
MEGLFAKPLFSVLAEEKLSVSFDYASEGRGRILELRAGKAVEYSELIGDDSLQPPLSSSSSSSSIFSENRKSPVLLIADLELRHHSGLLA